VDRTRSRLAAALAAVVVAGALVAGLPTASATAAVVPACSNAACPDPTGWAAARWNTNAGYPSNGGTVDGANCTNYVAWRLMRTGGFTETQVRGLGSASVWDTQAASRGYTVDRVAAVGAVAQWDNNHVAYVEQVNTDGTIVLSESNVWAGTSSNRMWLRHRVISASAVDHFIHFRPTPPRSVLAPGDFDGDGFADVMAVRTDGVLKLYSGDGAGAFLDPAGTRIGTGWAQFRRVIPAGDFSGDHFADVFAIATDGRMYLYRGNGAGRWLPSRKQVGTGWQTLKSVFSPGDFSGDGLPDLLAVRSDGRLVLYRGNGAGGWKGTRTVFGAGFASARLVASAGDFDGDGKADVIAVASDGTVKLYRGNGTGTLLDPAGTVIASGWTDVTAIAGSGDVTGDGKTDLIAVRTGGQLFVHPGDGAALSLDGIPISVTW
jgi:surface antigen